MADSNPANFANPATETVKEIASMGGKASHGSKTESDGNTSGRNPVGTFTKGSAAAKEAGHVGGLHSHHLTGVNEMEVQTNDGSGRNADGTFVKDSEAAKAAGHLGGLHAHGETDPEIEHQPGRNPDGTFIKDSEAAKQACHVGGMHAHAHGEGCNH